MKLIWKVSLFFMAVHGICTVSYQYIHEAFLYGVDMNIRYAIFVAIQFGLMMAQSTYLYNKEPQIQWLKLLSSVFLSYFVGMLVSPVVLEMLGRDMSNANLLGDGIKLFLGVGIFFSFLSVRIANIIASKKTSLAN